MHGIRWRTLVTVVLSLASNVPVGAIITQWGAEGDIPVPADYDGDGKADLAFFRPVDHTWHILGSKGTSWANVWGGSDDLPVPGDYDGDGQTDLAVFRGANGAWHILGTSGKTWTNSWGAPGDIPVPADYDGDRQWDYAFFRPAEHKWHIQSTKGNKWTSSWGATGDVPFAGDYDGDGKADAATFRPVDGAWYISVHGWTRWLVPFAVPEGIPHVGDYNGDGKTDVAFWHPSKAAFHISFTAGKKEIILWGTPGDIAAPADYDGDGKMDAAIFRPTDGTWHIRERKTDASPQEIFQYNSRSWQTQDGLPHPFVQAIAQTHDGPLWLGTAAGLVSFDGIRFTPLDIQAFPELKAQSIRLLFRTKGGSLLIAPEKGGLFRFAHGRLGFDQSVGQRQVRAIHEGRDGVLWLGTTNGLGRCQNEKWEWISKTHGLPDDLVLALCEDPSGSVWIGTAGGLVLYQDNQLKKSPYPVSATGAIRALHYDRENNLWIGTANRGVLRVSGDSVNNYSKAEGLPELFINSIFADSRGDLWVGTSGGLCRWTGEQFTTELNMEGRSYETILSLAEDAEGTLWIGTKEGLHQLSVRHFQSYSMREGLARNNVMSVSGDARNDLWFATWGGGLGRWHNGKISSYRSENSPLHDVLLSLYQTKDESLWIGADFDGGLFQFRKGSFVHYGKEHGIVDPAIRVMCEDQQGDLWIGTSGGLYRKRENSFQRFTTADGLAGNMIRALLNDRQGGLWIGTSEGLTRRSGDRFSPVPLPDRSTATPVLALLEDREGNLWIGTEGLGLMRWNGRKLSSCSSQDGLFSDTIFEIVDDDYGYLWMSCLAGVFRVSKKDFEDFDREKRRSIGCVSFGKADGMSTAQCNGVAKPAGWKAKDGRLWFPTTHGLVVVDPRRVPAAQMPPPVLIEEVIADKRIQRVQFKARASDRSAPAISNVESEILNLAPGRGEVEFRYTAFSFRAPEKCQFKYQLEGVDSDWVHSGSRRAAYYNSIKPGTYVFRVKASNHEGIWNQTAAAISIRLQPHFWQTVLFKALVGFTAVGLIAGAARYVTWKKVQGKLLRLEQQHAIERERTRIAQDMHDDLGARLTGILLLSRNAQETNSHEPQGHLEKISGAVEEAVDNLHAIVWAVNPQNDTLDNLVTYIQQHAQSFLKLSSIRCRFDLPDQLPHWPLPSDLRHNLFMALKEALNNVVKHAQASEVWFRVEIKDATLQFVIEDDGCGFDPGNTSIMSNGLSNMKKRLDQIGGEFEVKSRPGKGTRICLRILLQH